MYSPTTHANFEGEEIIPVFIFMHDAFIFMYENKKFPCMKFSCHDFFMHGTFCTGKSSALDKNIDD